MAALKGRPAATRAEAPVRLEQRIAGVEAASLARLLAGLQPLSQLFIMPTLL